VAPKPRKRGGGPIVEVAPRPRRPK
jgi:hypothetical protein